jgi:hypothetical protein
VIEYIVHILLVADTAPVYVSAAVFYTFDIRSLKFTPNVPNGLFHVHVNISEESVSRGALFVPT